MDESREETRIGLPLKDVLQEIATAFRDARTSANDHEDGPIIGWVAADLEIAAAVTRDASGKIRAWVVEGGGGRSRTETIKINVHLSPWGTDMMQGGM